MRYCFFTKECYASQEQTLSGGEWRCFMLHTLWLAGRPHARLGAQRTEDTEDGLANELGRVWLSFLRLQPSPTSGGFFAVRGNLGSATTGTNLSEAATSNPAVPETRGQKQDTGDPPKACSRVVCPSPNCHKRATAM